MAAAGRAGISLGLSSPEVYLPTAKSPRETTEPRLHRRRRERERQSKSDEEPAPKPRDAPFALAFPRRLGKVTEEFLSRRARGADWRRDPRGEERRMTKQVTMAAATASHAEGGTTLNAF